MLIAARPAEYETATMQWMNQAVQAVMRARDPVYAQLRPETVETVPQQRIDLGDGRELSVEPYQTAVHGAIEIDPLIAGDLGGLHAEICSIADQQLEQTLGAWFAVMNDVTRQTGNVVDANGDVAVGLLDALEKVEIAFDDDGNPALQMIVFPAEAACIRAQLEALTPDRHARRLGGAGCHRPTVPATRPDLPHRPGPPRAPAGLRPPGERRVRRIADRSGAAHCPARP